MPLPSRNNPVWADIISGQKSVGFEFLALKIFLMTAKTKLKNDPAILPQLVNDLYELFEKNQHLPAVQKDLQKI